jgi:hypothetical protein
MVDECWLSAIASSQPSKKKRIVCTFGGRFLLDALGGMGGRQEVG